MFALVLSPTRELALQIADQFKVLAVGFNLRVSTIIGRTDFTKQALDLIKIPHVVSLK